MDGGVVRMQLLVRPRACVVESASDARSSALVASRKYPGGLASVSNAHNLKIKTYRCLCALIVSNTGTNNILIGNKSEDLGCARVYWIRHGQLGNQLCK